MTNKKSTKKVLLSSMLSLILCMAMLIGTTFAWFTDNVTSGNNRIASGNLDIELEYSDDMSDWKTVKDATEIFDSQALWEPGYTEVVYLKLTNKGSLDLKYQFGMNIISEKTGINQDGNEFKLSDYIEFGVIEDVTTKYSGRDAALAAVTESKIISAGYSSAGQMTEQGQEKYFAMVVYMPETVGNVANHNGTDIPEIQLGLSAVATQLASEVDSFDETYDIDAVYADTTYNNVTDLAATLAQISASDDKIALINLGSDVEWETGASHGSTPLITQDSGVEKVYINGNGYTLTATGSGVGSMRAANGATMILSDMKVVDNSVSYAEGSWEFTYLEMGGNLICNNVTFADEIQLDSDDAQTCKAEFVNCTFESNEESVYAVWVCEGNASFKNCTFTGYRGLKAHEDYGSEIVSVSVDNCTFKDISKKPGIALGTLNADTTISIKNSNFVNCQDGDQKLYIYETDTDVTTINFTEKSNVVTNKTIVSVNDEATLKNALTGAGLAGSGNTYIEFSGGDIDMTGKSWTPVEVDGYHGADIVTIDGNGATITGLSAPLFAGGFAGGSGIVIKNLTIEDSQIEAGSEFNATGAGAFVCSVDSMDVITLENCHLVNSTVKGSRTGGLIGWTSGYNVTSDGPVDSYITVRNCSVVGCTIEGQGTVGAINGHAGCNPATYTTIEACTIKNNTLISYDDSYRVGIVVGTANVGEVTINNITESGNTLKQINGSTEIARPDGQSNFYGRFVPGTTGKLIIDGVAITK